MNTNEKQNKLKISKIFLTLGIVALIVGVAILVVGILQYKEAKADYQVAYDKWFDAWWNDKTATLNEQPVMPGMPIIAFLGGFIAFLGLPCLFIGIRPFIMKMGAKMHSETMDYAGKDISEAATKTIDVAKPVIEKGAEVITPVVGNLAGTIAESISEGINNGKKGTSEGSIRYCSNCGSEVNKKSKFCSNCGTKIES